MDDENRASEKTRSDHQRLDSDVQSTSTATTIRISVVVPALNEEKLIEKTLNAFSPDLRARYGMELIVSDGGSSDRTLEIARRHADIVVEHTESRKQTIAEGRNKGAERASGELLVFINSDTVPADSDRFASALVEVAEQMRSGRLVAIACPIHIAPDERRLSDRLFHPMSNTLIRLGNRLIMGMGRGECQIIWRAMFEHVGGYRNDFAAAEDNDLYQRLARQGKIGHHPGLLVYESPRRYRRYGYHGVLWIWFLNAAFQLTRGRPYSKEWEPIR